MKYLKEVCEICEAIEETPLTHISNGTNEKMNGFKISIMNNDSRIPDLKASTKYCLCKKCIGLAEKELTDFIGNSKYFKKDDKGLF